MGPLQFVDGRRPFGLPRTAPGRESIRLERLRRPGRCRLRSGHRRPVPHRLPGARNHGPRQPQTGHPLRSLKGLLDRHVQSPAFGLDAALAPGGRPDSGQMEAGLSLLTLGQTLPRLRLLLRVIPHFHITFHRSVSFGFLHFGYSIRSDSHSTPAHFTRLLCYGQNVAIDYTGRKEISDDINRKRQQLNE